MNFDMSKDSNNLASSITPNGNIEAALADFSITQITPHLYVGAENLARDYNTVFSNQIGCIINVAIEVPQIIYPPQTGIESLKYPILDLPTFPISNYLNSIVDRIAANTAANRRTLIYCRQGRSRSITFTLAYLIKHHHFSLPTAFAWVKSRRPLASPNIGFWSQLQSYESMQHKLVPQIQNQPLNALAYGEQMLNKIADGFHNVFSDVSTMNQYQNIKMKPYHHSSRHKSSEHSYPYRSYRVRVPVMGYHKLRA